MYNPVTSEIAKPSELLNSVKAIMSVLQSIENYGKRIQTVSSIKSGFQNFTVLGKQVMTFQRSHTSVLLKRFVN